MTNVKHKVKNEKELIEKQRHIDKKKKMSVWRVTVPDLSAGCYLGPEGNRVSSGEGGEGGHGPQEGGKDKQSVLSEGLDNMGKDEENWTRRMGWRRISRTEWAVFWTR
jgi:hypothetical protein